MGDGLQQQQHLDEILISELGERQWLSHEIVVLFEKFAQGKAVFLGHEDRTDHGCDFLKHLGSILLVVLAGHLVMIEKEGHAGCGRG